MGSAILFYRRSSARLKIEEIRTKSLKASMLLHIITDNLCCGMIRVPCRNDVQAEKEIPFI